jgi:octopine/nopaline transport system permease protein
VSSTFVLLGFGQQGWGYQLLLAALMTLAVSASAFATGICFGTLGAWAKLAHSALPRRLADGYTTIVRGVPDLLVIYLFYFGGSTGLSGIAHLFGLQGFYGLNGFMVGTLAVGLVSGAYETEVLRGAFSAIPPGEIEAARAVGMGGMLMLRRIIAPRVLHFALPGMGNVWQQVLKESALISVTGLVEIMRQTQIGAGSTRQPFQFYIAGFVLYLILTTVSGVLFRAAERHSARGLHRT